MGALAPVVNWIPEDDLLLKNAVEAGASLESLAKGAVQFSRRFTVRELQDRWFSLLYDPAVAAEASARMTDLERSASTFPSKFIRYGNSKDNKCVTGKRKAESVRSCYYALCKRISNEPFDSMDLSFLVGPNTCNNGDEFFSGNCIPGDPTTNTFGLGVSEMDTMAGSFPQNLSDIDTDSCVDATINSFHGFQNPAQGNFPIEQNNLQAEIPHILDQNMPLTVNSSGFDKMQHSKDFPEQSLFRAGELGVEQVNNDQSNMCSEFGENNVFNSHVSECGVAFNSMEYPSPLPGMPIWKTVSASALPVDIDLGEKDLYDGDTFQFPDDYDARNIRRSEYDVHADAKVKMEMVYDEFNDHASPDGYLAELSNSLLNFTSEEELLFMDADGKEMVDKSYYDGLSSLLLSSPNDVSQDQITNVTEPEKSVAPEVCIANSPSSHLVTNVTEPEKSIAPEVANSPGSHLVELHNNGGCHDGDEQVTCSTQIHQIQPSVTALNNQFPELKDGVICCTTNTEDPEVPCNDDVFQSNHPASMSSIEEKDFSGAKKPISSSNMDFSSRQRASDKGPSLMHIEPNNPGESSHTIGSHVSQEMSRNPPVGPKFAVPKTDSIQVAPRVAVNPSGGPAQFNTASASKKAPIPGMLKEVTREVLMAKQFKSTNSHVEEPAFDSAGFKSYPRTNGSGIKEEYDVPDSTREQGLILAELTAMNSAVSEPLINPPTSDQEELLIESDDDVPLYSDIEAMILDMDLNPDDQDFLSCEEVLRYQREETKRAVIRLEQSAHSHMQRAIASHGALAILYGHHSKHYIKKSEVLIGRATGECTVDIDLGREGHLNKISRKQAIIKMEQDGAFSLQNLGKFSISVNGKEVGPGQSQSLSSSCLIEIKGMPFIFEMNQTRVKHYPDSIGKNT
ncbi:hypothetical protein UlMin_034154 [Ulmus minor]